MFYNFQKNASLETLRFKISMKGSPQVSLKDIFFNSVLLKPWFSELMRSVAKQNQSIFSETPQ